MTGLIESLIGRQQQAGESDKLFARRLGLSRQAWQKIRTGESGAGARALAGIVRAYPDLGSVVQSYLSSSANFLPSRDKNVSSRVKGARKGAAA